MSQLRAGAILSYVSIIVSILIALVYTPIMIRLLGQSEFGLYSLIGSLAAYFSVMDMGLGNAMVRFTAKNRVVGDDNQIANLNGLFLMFYTVIGVITVAVGVTVYNNINTIFEGSLTNNEILKAKTMVFILIINFALSFPLSIFNSLMKAYERFIAERLISIVRIILVPIVTLPIIYLGYGAVSMVLITTVVNLGTLVFSGFYCFKKLEVKITFGNINRSLVKEILGYSFFIFLAVIVDQIYWQTDQIILGAVSGTLSVAVYAIAIQFIKLYIQFSSSISGLFLPKMTMMVANEATNDDLTNIMIRYGRIQYLIITLILSGFILFGKTFINYWAGPNYSNAYYIVLIIMLPLTVPLIQNVGISILYAKNLQAFRSIVLLLIAIINIIISIPIAKEFGATGVAFITSITLLLGNILIMNIYYYRRIGLNIPRFWKSVSNITIVVLAIMLLGVVINYLIPNTSLIVFIFKIMFYTLLHLTIIYLVAFNQYEKKVALSFFNRIRGIFS